MAAALIASLNFHVDDDRGGTSFFSADRLLRACAKGTDNNYLAAKDRGPGITLTPARMELMPNKDEVDFFGWCTKIQNQYKIKQAV